MNEVYIFDIDGCIMPPIISNFNKDGEPREKLVNEVKKIGRRIKLYSNFISYYKKSCKHAKSVFFITGRKYSEFGKLTESKLDSLKKLKAFQIVYYPENKSHVSDEYFEWKTNIVQKIIKRNINAQNDGNYVIFHIFDDLNDYFPNLKELSKQNGFYVNLSQINGEKSWKKLVV